MPSTNTDRQVFCFFFMTAARGPLFLHKYQSFSHSASFALIQFFFLQSYFHRKALFLPVEKKVGVHYPNRESFWKVFGAIMYMKFVWCYPSVLLRTPVFLSLWFWIYVLMLISNPGCIACFVPIPQFMWGGRCIFHCFFIEDWCTFCNHCNKWVCCRQRSTMLEESGFKNP